MGKEYFIYKIQVCTNKKRDTDKRRLKGIKIWGASIKSDGSLKKSGSPASYRRANCKRWGKAVSCPSGKIAVGMRAYYESTKRGFAGMAMQCAKPVKK